MGSPVLAKWTANGDKDFLKKGKIEWSYKLDVISGQEQMTIDMITGYNNSDYLYAISTTTSNFSLIFRISHKQIEPSCMDTSSFAN